MPKMIAVDELHAMLQSVQNGLTMLRKDPRFARMDSDIAAGITATNEIRKMIARMDAVEAEPVVHGKWWYREYQNEKRVTADGQVVCNRCHALFPRVIGTWFRYCPRCGAMMDAKEEEHATD